MGLMPRLSLRPAQSLTLTPQLMQSIKLLQLSHLELSALVDAEVLRNPLLEREDGAEVDNHDLPERDPEISAYEDTLTHSERIQDAASIADGFDTPLENVFPEQNREDRLSAPFSAEGRAGGSHEGEAPDFEQFVAARPSLADHLFEQASLILSAQEDRLIAGHLIHNLDEAGYLAAPLALLATQLGIAEARIERVLGQLQGCEPVGVFARDVPECLAIQLRERDRLDPMMARLLENLDKLVAHDMAGLMRVLGCDREDLSDMLAELRRLDPHPGRAFDQAPVDALIPDVFVREGRDGDFRVELNAEVLPRVLVNRQYHASVSRRAMTGADRVFLSECLANASWLTKSLDQRAQTILKVAMEIVRQQDGFFRHGVTHLKPMTLKVVADAIGMHESTVSRVTANKAMATPRGLFELKYFFTTALSSATGEADHSAEAVRHRIRQLIEGEPPGAVLSDDAIAEMLEREQRIAVARRTVAKYREGMNIPSSVIRRKQKRALDPVR